MNLLSRKILPAVISYFLLGALLTVLGINAGRLCQVQHKDGFSRLSESSGFNLWNETDSEDQESDPQFIEAGNYCRDDFWQGTDLRPLKYPKKDLETGVALFIINRRLRI